MACVKHFACNSMENARFSVDIEVDDVALHEVFLPHFKRAIDEGAASVMSAYNSVNGEWCGQSHQLLRKVLLPLALPDIINNLRLVFGVAFGYIMLAEVIDAKRGLGFIIIQSQRVGPREHIYLCLIIITLLAYGID